ncbi:MAG: hypothetical protein JSS11_16375, partial [Verrucomicrobia bacterium]|nr:hypothetical protein [Verrucomicrobiota bacterium]
MNNLRTRKFKALSLLATMSLLAVSATAQTGNQTTSKDETVTLEKFTVTGSNIPMASEQLAVPVNVI